MPKISRCPKNDFTVLMHFGFFDITQGKKLEKETKNDVDGIDKK